MRGNGDNDRFEKTKGGHTRASGECPDRTQDLLRIQTGSGDTEMLWRCLFVWCELGVSRLVGGGHM